MTTQYSDHQVDVMLNARLRRGVRPMPWRDVAKVMLAKPISAKNVEILFWKVVTGYSGTNADGPRRVYKAGPFRESNAGKPWQPCDDAVLESALGGEGQRRTPPCDYEYVAAILGRSEQEVEMRWAKRKGDPLGRAGFGLMAKGR